MADDVSKDLAQAIAKLKAAQELLQPLLDVHGGELAPLAARLEWVAAEVARIEGVVAGQSVMADV